MASGPTTSGIAGSAVPLSCGIVDGRGVEVAGRVGVERGVAVDGTGGAGAECEQAVPTRRAARRVRRGIREKVVRRGEGIGALASIQLEPWLTALASFQLEPEHGL